MPEAGWYRDPSNEAGLRLWDGGGWTAQVRRSPEGPAEVMPAIVPPSATVSTVIGGLSPLAGLILVAGLAIVVGSFLPWFEATVPTSSSGVGYIEGWVTILAGLWVVMAAFLLRSRPRSAKADAVGASLLTLVMVITQAVAIGHSVQDVSDPTIVGFGPGLPVIGLAALIAFFSGFQIRPSPRAPRTLWGKRRAQD